MPVKLQPYSAIEMWLIIIFIYFILFNAYQHKATDTKLIKLIIITIQGCAWCLTVRDRYQDWGRGVHQPVRDETETKTLDSKTDTSIGLRHRACGFRWHLAEFALSSQSYFAFVIQFYAQQYQSYFHN